MFVKGPRVSPFPEHFFFPVWQFYKAYVGL